MKKLMPIIAVTAILLGSSCDTYTSSTQPCDLCSGWITPGNRIPAGHTASYGVAEANNNATFDNKTIKTIGTERDTLVLIGPDTLVAPAATRAIGN